VQIEEWKGEGKGQRGGAGKVVDISRVNGLGFSTRRSPVLSEACKDKSLYREMSSVTNCYLTN